MSIFGKKLSKKGEALLKVPLFSDLTHHQIEALEQQADEVPMKAGTVLTKQGGLGQEFMLLLDGTARVEKDGNEIAKLSAGDYFGEISLIDGGVRTATVVAETDVQLLVIHVRSFGYLLDKIPELSRSLLNALCKYLRKAEETRPM